MQRLLTILLVISCMLTGCGKKAQPTSILESIHEQAEQLPTPVLPDAYGFRDQMRDPMQSAKLALEEFYLEAFEIAMTPEYRDSQTTLTLANHFAHRLWVERPDAGRDAALEMIQSLASYYEVELGAMATSQAGIVQAPYFSDAVQLHRDQYAMILSEVGLTDVPGLQLGPMLMIVRGDLMANILSQRQELAWSVTLLVKHNPPGFEWINAAGTRVSTRTALDGLLNQKVNIGQVTTFSCFDLHVLYALAAAVDAGYADYQADLDERFEKAFDYAAALGADPNLGEIPISQLSGCIKIDGHLLEAYFRAAPEFVVSEDSLPRIEVAIERLIGNIEALVGRGPVEAQPNIFVDLPHAIHGLELALRRL